MLEDCCVIFSITSLLGRTDMLINHPLMVEKSYQLDLPSLFLLPNFLMFSLPFSQPHLTFTFESGIVMVNPQFVDSDHSHNTCNLDLKVSSGSPWPAGDKVLFVLVWANEEPIWETHASFWVLTSVFGSPTFLACLRSSQMF